MRAPPAAPRQVLRIAAHTAMGVAAGALLVATALGFTGRWYWTYDLLAAFRAQYVLGFAVLCVVALTMRAKIPFALAAVGLVVNAVLVVPLYIPASSAGTDTASQETESSPALRVLVLNVYTNNPRKDEVTSYVEASGADLVFLSEVDRAWVVALEADAPSYLTLAAEPRSDNFGMMALALREVAASAQASGSIVRLLPDESDRPSIDVRLSWAGSELSVLSVHTLPPMSPGRWAILNAQMLAVTAWAGGQQTAVVVGDLNSTPWSWPFRRLQASSDLLNSELGYGVQPTWPARFPWALQIPIDHVLHDSALSTVDRHVGPNVGSDHLPVHVTLVRVDPSH